MSVGYSPLPLLCLFILFFFLYFFLPFFDSSRFPYLHPLPLFSFFFIFRIILLRLFVLYDICVVPPLFLAVFICFWRTGQLPDFFFISSSSSSLCGSVCLRVRQVVLSLSTIDYGCSFFPLCANQCYCFPWMRICRSTSSRRLLHHPCPLLFIS